MHRCHATTYNVLRGTLLCLAGIVLVMALVNAILIGRLYWRKRKEANPRIRTHTLVAVLTCVGMGTNNHRQSYHTYIAAYNSKASAMKVRLESGLAYFSAGLGLYLLSMFNMWYIKGHCVRTYAVLAWRWVCR